VPVGESDGRAVAHVEVNNTLSRELFKQAHKLFDSATESFSRSALSFVVKTQAVTFDDDVVEKRSSLRIVESTQSASPSHSWRAHLRIASLAGIC
jgi:hypothetical protein